MLMFPMICNLHFVCLPCRRSIKGADKAVCAICRREMVCVGKKFTTPRKRDDAAWKKLGWLIQNGWRGYSWSTSPETTLRQTQERLEVAQQQNLKEAQKRQQDGSLEERRRSIKRRHRAAKSKFARSKIGRRQVEAELEKQEKYQNAVLEAVASNPTRAEAPR